MESVRLIENFCSFQGEGPDIGKTMLILRFKKCNRNCMWCDTKVKMRISNEANYPLSEIQEIINEKNAGLLITGGEPTFRENFNQTVALLNELKYPSANVETNGFQLEKMLKQVNYNGNIKFMYSPKIFSVPDLKEAYELTEQIQNFTNVYFKVVFEDNDFIHSYLQFISNNKTIMSTQRVYLMPEGTTRVDILRSAPAVFDACEKYKVGFSSRTHIMYGFV